MRWSQGVSFINDQLKGRQLTRPSVEKELWTKEEEEVEVEEVKDKSLERNWGGRGGRRPEKKGGREERKRILKKGKILWQVGTEGKGG